VETGLSLIQVNIFFPIVWKLLMSYLIFFALYGNILLVLPRYVGPFEITERIGPVAYRLRLPQELSNVHDTFHVSNLKKCLDDQTLHIP
jgi:hypothetical protein